MKTLAQKVYILNTPPGWTKTPPLALIYLENYLKQHSVDVHILDLNIELFKLLDEPKEQWLNLNTDFENSLFDKVAATHPEFFTGVYDRLTDANIIGLSLFMRNAPFTLKFAETLKNKFPDKRIVIGGPHVLRLERENKLSPGYTWVIGEGEMPLLEIAQCNQSKIFKFNEIDNLDSLPITNFDAIDFKNYSPVIPLFASRGCRFKCAFCAERLLYKKLRQQSARKTVDQIKALKAKHNINTFVFCDSMINSDPDWLKDFCRLLIDEKINIKWEAQFRITPDFPQTTADAMRESGCYNLFIGMESASDRVLRSMSKGYDSSMIKGCLTVLHNAGLHYEISLIFGYPGESENDFNSTINFILNNKDIIPKIAQANPFVDYLNEFPFEIYPSREGTARVEKFLKIIEQENIKFTKSFINNLIY